MDEETLKQKLPIGAKFRHYKGKEYKILAIGRHSEDQKLYVVYQGLYNDQVYGNLPIWIRPIEMFFETVNFDGKEVARFVQV